MPYVTTIERLAKEEGHQEGRQAALREDIVEASAVRFGPVPAELSEKLQTITDLTVLKQFHRQALTVSALEDFRLNAPMD